ncbi:MAG: dockerin type I repeat-containing protein, partial [Clostridia bacterium]|nr:dockerin type I repeat-containing protein [Clostridia bacterium]
MRKTRKHSWLIGLALVLILAVCLSLPVAASAPVSEGDDGVGTVQEGDDGVGTVQEGGTVPSDGFPNLPAGTVLVGNNATTLALDTEELYGVEVFAACGEGVEFASYQINFYLPEFVTLDSVVCADEDALFTWNCTYDYLSVACSTTTDRAYGLLFTVYFYLNEDATLESAGAFEESGETFTNTSYERLPVITLFGEISVYEEMPLKGDVNLDGEITIDDAIALQQILVGINDQPRFFTDGFYAADVNNDNLLDIIDVQYIQMYLIGEIDSLEDIYAEDPLLLIRVNFFDQYGNVLANRVVTAPPAGEATTTYPALVEFVNQWAGSLFPGMTVESLYAESGADVYAATSIVTGDDVLNVFLRSDKGDEPFTYDENEVQTRVSTDGQFTVYQYADAEDLAAALVGNTITVEKYVERDGEYHTISCNGYVLTEDNLGDLSNVDCGTINEYVYVSVFVNGEEYVIDLRVVPNTDGLEFIMEGVRRETYINGNGQTAHRYYYFIAYGNGLIESCDFDLRNDDTAWRDYMEYEAVWENDVRLFAIDQGGMTFYYMQSDESYCGYPLVTEYRPEREEQTTSYTLSLGANMSARFEVFGNDYAMMFQTNPRTGAMELAGTVKVEIN